MNHNNLFLFKHTILQSHSIIYGGHHLWQQAWDTLRGFHVISQNFMQNFSFSALRMASSKRFCEMMVSQNACQVKNADHKFTRQKCCFCSISCVFHFEWWSDHFFSIIGYDNITSIPTFGSVPNFAISFKIQVYPKMEDLTSFPNWIWSTQERHIEEEVTPHANIPVRWLCPLWHAIRRRWHLWFLPRHIRHPSITITPQLLDSKL